MLKEAWTLAIQTLRIIEMKRFGERLALNNATKKLRICDPKVIGLAHKLVSEAIRKKNFIDLILNSVLSPRSIKDLKPSLRFFLRLYVNETKFTETSIEKASKIIKMGRSILGWYSFKDVEEILGKILSVNHKVLTKGLNEFEKIGLQTYNPTWFVKYCFRLFGRQQALLFLKKSTDVTSTYIRLNLLKAQNQDLLKIIKDEKIILEKVPKLKYTYKLIETKKPLIRTKSFDKGLFYIQDKASCLAVEIANPQQENIVFDLCAAPGSKTTYLAQLMNNKGKIISFDYSKRRIRILKKEIEFIGIKNVQLITADVRKDLPIKILSDLVILDPPCTSTGTFGRNPDAKWRLTKRSILGMALIQTEMINECVNYLKTGGFLVYSTCSITLEENEMVIEKFLKLHPEFSLVDSIPKIGVPGYRGLTQCQRLYPHLHDCNGFFIAKLKKNN